MVEKVMVYWNLHRKCWSIKAKGKPVRHAQSVRLAGVSFRVRQGGRAKVLATGQKNVHAFVVGTVVPSVAPSTDGVPVSYNPYRNPEQPGTFYRKDTGATVACARAAQLVAGKVVAFGVE